MNDFNKNLKKLNEDIEEKELEIVKLEFDLKYLKIIIKKLQEKKRKLLQSYRY